MVFTIRRCVQEFILPEDDCYVHLCTLSVWSRWGFPCTNNWLSKQSNCYYHHRETAVSVACTVGSLNRHILLYDMRATEEAQNAMTGYKSCNKRGTAYQQTNFPTEDYSHGALGGGGAAVLTHQKNTEDSWPQLRSRRSDWEKCRRRRRVYSRHLPAGARSNIHLSLRSRTQVWGRRMSETAFPRVGFAL